jgi:hypothetical protein
MSHIAHDVFAAATTGVIGAEINVDSGVVMY